jgi:hypothetical protein
MHPQVIEGLTEAALGDDLFGAADQDEAVAQVSAAGGLVLGHGAQPAMSHRHDRARAPGP